MSNPNNDQIREVTRAHEIEAVLNSGGRTVHYCLVCGQMGVSLAPELPCQGPPIYGSGYPHDPKDDRE